MQYVWLLSSFLSWNIATTSLSAFLLIYLHGLFLFARCYLSFLSAHFVAFCLPVSVCLLVSSLENYVQCFLPLLLVGILSVRFLVLLVSCLHSCSLVAGVFALCLRYYCLYLLQGFFRLATWHAAFSLAHILGFLQFACSLCWFLRYRSCWNFSANCLAFFLASIHAICLLTCLLSLLEAYCNFLACNLPC